MLLASHRERQESAIELMQNSARPGRLFVIAAPSGAGKTSLVKALLDREPRVRVSVSHTTRKPRQHEMNGRDYFFVSIPEFQAMIAADAFVEHARVFDNFYGTSRAALDQACGAGYDVILEIDWQGARQVRQALPDCRLVFILPPSRAALEIRLRNRRTDNEEVIQRRLRDAVGDMSHCREFDFVIINDDFDRAVSDLQHVIRGESTDLAAGRAALEPLLRDLLASP